MKKLLLLASLLGATPALAAHAVFDLAANRTLAHLQHAGGLYVPAGAPGFAKYVHFSRPLSTWKLRAVEEGKKVALAQTQAVLEVPLTAAQARATQVVMRLKSPVKGTVRIKSGAAVPLQPGWQIVNVPVSGLSEGENKITLTFAEKGTIGGQKASAAVDWILIGATAEADLPGSDLKLKKGDGAAWYIQVPPQGGLTTSGCALHVEARTHNDKLATDLTPGGSVDLSKLAGHVARLELTAAGDCQLGGALTTGSEPAAATAAPHPKNVVFWMTDDTRADKYKLWNPKSRVETPVLDAFVKKATLFKTAYVQGNESRVSHASVWTGMYPAQHKFIAEKAKLNPEFVTLAEVIKPAGLYTIGLMANGFISTSWGFGEGWDVLHNYIHEGGGLKGEDLVKAAKKLLVERSKSPFFLYLGTIDAHVSWRAHQPWMQKYDPDPYTGPFVKGCSDPQLDQIVAGKLKVNERDKVRIVAAYDSDISYNDQQFGEMMKLLEAGGHADDTMVILTADHGEEFWDHGRIGHGQSLRQELIHVPLVVYYPPLFPPGKVVEEGVESVDILPTIAEALGMKTPPDVQGESLIPLARGVGAGYPRPAIGSQYELAHAMRLGRWKLWVGGSGDTKFIDAANDLAEEKELSGARPLERRFVTDALGVWMAYQGKWKKGRWGVASNHKPALAEDLEK